MKETSTRIGGLLTGALSGAWDAWTRFWFTPANPTTMGLIRICAGILIFYVHLAYSYDLFEFFGKDGWMSLKVVNRQRAQSPWLAPALNWDGMKVSLSIPDDPQVREELFAFLAKVPDDERSRRRMIEFVKAPAQAPKDYLPDYVQNLPDGPAEDEVPPPEDDAWRSQSKWQLVRFIKGLPADRAERESVLEYMRFWSFDPRTLYRQGYTNWSVWYHVTEPGWMVVTHIAILAVMLMFTLGFCTRLTAVLSWLGAVSYINRSSITLFGGDTMLNILLIYLMIAPSGAALSVDRLLARWWAVRKARREGRPVPPWAPPAPSIAANFAQRMLMIHFCIIYFAAGTSKLLGGYWWNGNAIYYTMANYEFAPLNREFYLGLMRWLAQHRTLWEIVMTGGTYYTLALELSLPLLVWNRRLRPFFVACSMLLHIFIALFMGLVAFSLLMATMVMAFIPGDMVQPLFDRFRRRLFPEDKAPPEPALAESPPEEGGPALAAAEPSKTAITDKPGKKKAKAEKAKEAVPDSEVGA
jgi:hypothetical protein